MIRQRLVHIYRAASPGNVARQLDLHAFGPLAILQAGLADVYSRLRRGPYGFEFHFCARTIIRKEAPHGRVQ